MSEEVLDDLHAHELVSERAEETPEEKPFEGEQRYRELFDSVSEGLFQIDLEGNFIIINPAFASMLGYEPEELLEKGVGNWWEIIAEDEIKAIKKEVNERGELRERLIRLPRRDGSVSWLEASFSLRRAASGEPIGYGGVLRDVTDRIRYERRLEALHRHASRLGGAASLDEIAELTFDSIEQILGFNLGSFSVIDGEVLREIHNRGLKTYEMFKLPLDGSGITVRAVRTGETQLIPDVRVDADYVIGPAEGNYEALSELDIPVKVDGEVIAVINLESTKLDAFTEEESKLLEILAGHVASAIQKIRLLESELQYEAKIVALHRHASELASAKTIDEVAEITLNTIDQVLGFPLGYFNVVEGDMLVPIFIKGVDVEPNRDLPLDGPGIIVRAVTTAESQLVPDTRKDEDYVPVFTVDGRQTLSELAVPVIAGSEVIAVLNIESERPNAFTEEDKRLLEIFAKHVASAFNHLIEMGRLRESEEKFKTLLEESMDAAAVIVGTEIVYANRKMAELVGLRDPSEYVGRDSMEFVADEDRNMVRTRTLGRQRGEQHVQRYEFKMRKTDGTEIDAETHVSLIDYEGKPASLEFTRDITERKQMERELRDYAERLEEMVEERTRKLREVERLATIGELAAMVGHDLRNPLTGIAGAAYFLKTRCAEMGDENVDKMLEILENNVKYSNKMVNDLLDYSKEIELDLSTTNPRSLVEEALDSVTVPGNVRVRDLTRAEHEIEVDTQRMKRVIINLVNNALDSMPSGGEITIESKLIKDDVELYFTDTGIGIPEDILEKIWKPLFTTKSRGMGFGLSICKRIVESHGGIITVKSKIGEGAIFIIRLPRRR